MKNREDWEHSSCEWMQGGHGGGRGRYSNIYVLNLKASFLLVKTSGFDHAKVWSPKLR